MESNKPIEEKKEATANVQTGQQPQAMAGPAAAKPVETPVAKEPTSEQPAPQPKEPGEAAKPTPGLGRTTINFSFYKVRKSLTEALNRSPRARTYTVVILTLVTVIFFVAFTIIPTVTTIISINAEIAQKERTYAALDKNVKTVDDLETEELSQKEVFAALHSAVPSEFEQKTFSENVQTLAEENNLEFDNIRFSSDIANRVTSFPAEFRRTEVTIVVRGEVADFVLFLNGLEDLNRLFAVDTLDYSLNLSGSVDRKEYIVLGHIYNARPDADWEALDDLRKTD